MRAIPIFYHTTPLPRNNSRWVFVRKEKWRPQCIAVKYSVHIFEYIDNLCDDSVLRFNPIQIGEWLNELSEHTFSNQHTLADAVGMSRTRVQQFLYLLRIPVDLRGRLKQMPGLTEADLRPLTKMEPVNMRAAAGRLLGMNEYRGRGMVAGVN